MDGKTAEWGRTCAARCMVEVWRGMAGCALHWLLSKTGKDGQENERPKTYSILNEVFSDKERWKIELGSQLIKLGRLKLWAS